MIRKRLVEQAEMRNRYSLIRSFGLKYARLLQEAEALVESFARSCNGPEKIKEQQPKSPRKPNLEMRARCVGIQLQDDLA